MQTSLQLMGELDISITFSSTSFLCHVVMMKTRQKITFALTKSTQIKYSITFALRLHHEHEF